VTRVPQPNRKSTGIKTPSASSFSTSSQLLNMGAAPLMRPFFFCSKNLTTYEHR
jgi:hypothetical protein